MRFSCWCNGWERRSQACLSEGQELPSASYDRFCRNLCATPDRRRMHPPSPRGLCRSLTLLSVGVAFATLPGPWRRRNAVLGFLPRERPCTTESGLARPGAGPPRLSSLHGKASHGNAAGLLHQGQASLGSVLRSLDTRPLALAVAAKGGSTAKTAEGQPLARPSNPRSASFHSPYKGGSPGKPRCALAVTDPSRESQTRPRLFESKTTKEKETDHAALSP